MKLKSGDARPNALIPSAVKANEHSFNAKMKKYSIRAKLSALLPDMNDRWAMFRRQPVSGMKARAFFPEEQDRKGRYLCIRQQ